MATPSTDQIIAHFLDRRRSYADGVKRGFPIVDNVYWDWPSPMIGGLFLIHLREAKAASGSASLDLRPKAYKVRPLSTVIDQLEKEHTPESWYRGHECARTAFTKERYLAWKTQRPASIRSTLRWTQ